MKFMIIRSKIIIESEREICDLCFWFWDELICGVVWF